MMEIMPSMGNIHTHEYNKQYNKQSIQYSNVFE